MPDPTPPQRPAVADELLRRMATDQHARGVRENGPHLAPDNDLMRTVDADNTAALARILDEYGWPGLSLVGEQATTAAWLIAQHAELDFQLHALNLLRDTVAVGEAPAWHLAYLTDRCLMHQREPQLFGTQYLDTGDGRGTRLWNVADPDHLDARRAEVGLGPHAEYEAAFRAQQQSAPTAVAPAAGAERHQRPTQ
nr:hypothetical protein OH820_11675 [Streptomyces sp. NBC_00857]